MTTLQQTPKDSYAAARREMIARQLLPRGISDARVLRAMGEVPREIFLPAQNRSRAYDDGAQAIGDGQTISQPYVVAWMSELLQAQAHHKTLEIGTGCGYQTAVLCKLVDHVYTIERIARLAEGAQDNLRTLKLSNYSLRVGDGSRGWPELAPFDRILCAAAPAGIPPALVEQLAPGGRLVLPVGPQGRQEMTVVMRDEQGAVNVEQRGPVAFVPLIGG
ncbi:MAG: protein-L-isoaspartate(D-aspartate) O-methyltransferase [Planctomycetes bacterium]|nr:protein-L-isoaspartate(D-aspartate) O-methyltransferase [Planctomycetota bacterium]